MLKKVMSVFATLVVLTALTNVGMTTIFAEDSLEETSVDMEVVTINADEDVITTTNNEANLKGGTCVCFHERTTLTAVDGREVNLGINERFYITARFDEEYYRIYVPKFGNATVKISSNENLEIVYTDALILGDLDHDIRVDVFDYVILRKKIVNQEGWGDILAYYMADMNCDGEIGIADLLVMRKWLLKGELDVY